MSLPEPRPMREFHGVDRHRFQEEIRPLRQPAVLRGLVAGWPAVAAAKGSDEELIAYLKSYLSALKVPVHVGAPEIQGRLFYKDNIRSLNFQTGKSAMEPFLDRLLRDRENAHPFAIAIQSEPIPDLLPGFEQDNRLDLLDPSIVPRAWMGNSVRVATHYDLQENIGCVVAGRRRFTLFPPEQMANLYPGPLDLTPGGTPVSLVDLDEPDLDRFPKFAAAAPTAQQAVLEPGDAIYIPFHWWHAVDSLERINLFVNYWWNDRRADTGNPYDALMHAFYALKHLPLDQREIWRRSFDYYIFETEGDPAEHLPPDARGILGPPTRELLAKMRATIKMIAGRM